MVSGDEFRSRPIFAAGFRLARERTRLLVAGVVYGIRTRVACLKDRCPRPARRTRQDPFRLCPSASDRRAGQVPSLHMGCDPVHIPPSPFPRRAPGGGARAHPKWSGRRGSNPWPRPWRGRALPIELHPLFVRGSRPASTGAASRHLVNERRCMRSVAARWPRAPRGRKTKRPGSIRNPGLSGEK